jgi:hypothetical protein
MQHKRRSVRSFKNALKEAFGDKIIITVMSKKLFHVRVSKLLTLHEVYDFVDKLSVDFGLNPKLSIQYF